MRKINSIHTDNYSSNYSKGDQYNVQRELMRKKSIMKYNKIKEFILSVQVKNNTTTYSDIAKELNFDENQLKKFIENSSAWPKGLLSKFIIFINENESLLGKSTKEVREYFKKNHSNNTIREEKEHIYQVENELSEQSEKEEEEQGGQENNQQQQPNLQKIEIEIKKKALHMKIIHILYKRIVL